MYMTRDINQFPSFSFYWFPVADNCYMTKEFVN
jgi:hypothetical protein